MKNLFAIPDDCFEMVLAYDGRYDKSRLMPSLRIIDIRLVTNPDCVFGGITTVIHRARYYEFIQDQVSCFQQQCFVGPNGQVSNREYEQELGRMSKKFKLDEKTGHIKGITYKEGGYKKQTLTKEDKNFSNVLGCFSLLKFHQKSITIDGIHYKSEMLWCVCLWTKYCEYEIHYNDKYLYKHSAPKTVRGNLPPMYLQFKEKNGIEVCDRNFILKNEKTKKGKALIKEMMKL